MSRYCILVAKVCQEGLLWRSMTQLTRHAARRVIRTGTYLPHPVFIVQTLLQIQSDDENVFVVDTALCRCD